MIGRSPTSEIGASPLRSAHAHQRAITRQREPSSLARPRFRLGRQREPSLAEDDLKVAGRPRFRGHRDAERVTHVDVRREPWRQRRGSRRAAPTFADRAAGRAMSITSRAIVRSPPVGTVSATVRALAVDRSLAAVGEASAGPDSSSTDTIAAIPAPVAAGRLHRNRICRITPSKPQANELGKWPGELSRWERRRPRRARRIRARAKRLRVRHRRRRAGAPTRTHRRACSGS